MKLPILTILLLGFVALSAKAEPFAASEIEIHSLPPLCQVKLGKPTDSPEYKSWEEKIGYDFIHIHHYCDCLRFQQRAFRQTERGLRNFNLNNAVAGCDYVLTHARPDFFMRPEILTQKAKALTAMDMPVEAVRELIKAIEFDPKYAPAYVALADYYVDRNNKKQALEYLERGLASAPESKALRNRYKGLGGSKPLPEIPAKPALEAAPESVPEKSNVGDGLSPAEIRTKREGADSATQVKNVPAEVDISTQTAPPKIGTRNNPYCRFCAEEDPPAAPAPATPATGATAPK